MKAKKKSKPIVKPEGLRLVIWPRGDGRYSVLGMVVLGEEVEEWKGKDTIVLDGGSLAAEAVTEILKTINGREPRVRVGDANNVVSDLSSL